MRFQKTVIINKDNEREYNDGTLGLQKGQWVYVESKNRKTQYWGTVINVYPNKIVSIAVDTHSLHLINPNQMTTITLNGFIDRDFYGRIQEHNFVLRNPCSKDFRYGDKGHGHYVVRGGYTSPINYCMNPENHLWVEWLLNSNKVQILKKEHTAKFGGFGFDYIFVISNKKIQKWGVDNGDSIQYLNVSIPNNLVKHCPVVNRVSKRLIFGSQEQVRVAFEIYEH